MRLSSGKAYVIGSGPNGLTAGILLAKAGLRTTIIEAAETIGGGARSAELTLPGFVHDVCSAIHPLAVASPIFQRFPLGEHGLTWIHPSIPLAHPLEGGSAATLSRSLEETCANLDGDGPAYRAAITPFADRWTELLRDVLAPPHVPHSPVLLARFGLRAILPAASSARRLFRTERARSLFAGLAAHSVLPLEAAGSSAFGWILALAGHTAGWPFPSGGAQNIANALASYFESLGGSIVTNTRIASLRDLDRSALILCDLGPKPFLEIAADELPEWYRRALARFRYGPGAFKVDWALREPIPWKAAECTRAGTVHVGGSLEEIARSEQAAANGEISESPFMLVAQQSLFDPRRAPKGQHTAWAYCHVPNGSKTEMTARIELQIERFAPGFRTKILARHTFSPAELEMHNQNLVGGDITGGAQNLKQLLLRPTRLFYRTPLKGVYLCSSSTPPGGGVHGMCGYHAARTALSDAGRISGNSL